MIMRKCERAFRGRRWQVLLYVLSVFGFLLLGSALSSAFRPASSTNKTSSVITIRSHAESWTASESEAVYREAQSFQDNEISELREGDYLDGIALLTREGHVSKYIWDYFPETNACPMKQKLGRERSTGDHGKWVCGVKTLLQKPGCVVYSIGSDGLTNFEQDIVSKTECEVHIFDPTLGLGLQQQLRRVKEFNFHDIGLIAEGAKGNRTAVEHYRNLQMQPLSALMATLGHEWIDVLKVDIEGWEWDVLDSWLSTWELLPFTQLQVEFHYTRDAESDSPDDRMEQPPPRQMLEILQRLQQRGMRLFNMEPNYWWGNSGAEFMELAYIQVGRNGHIVANMPGA